MRSKKQQVTQKVRTEWLAKLSFCLVSALAIGALIAVLGIIIRQAVPAYQQYGFFHMLFSTEYSQAGGYGIWGSLAVTLFTSVFAVLIAAPIALRVAFFVVFRARKSRKALQILINILAGVPSVVFGIFALRSLGIISNAITGGGGATIFNATIMLAMMVTPTMIALLNNQLKLVPRELIDGAISLGNTRTRALYKVVRKQIRTGFYVAIIAAFTRAIGETMAMSIVLKTGTNANPFGNGLDAFLNSAQRTLGAQIAVNIFSDSANANASAPHFAAGVWMFLLTMILIGGISYVSRKQIFTVQSPWVDFNKKRAQTKTMRMPLRNLVLSLNLATSPFKLINWIIFSAWQLVARALNYLANSVSQMLTKVFKLNTTKVTTSGYGSAWRERIAKGIDTWRLSWEWIALGILLGFLFWLVGDIFAIGLPAWTRPDWNFVQTSMSANVFEPAAVRMPGTLLNPMTFTLVIIGITILITLPFALMTALFLSEYAQNTLLGKIVRFFIDALNGTPSIIFGIFGMVFFTGNGLLSVSPGFSVMAGALTLLLVTLPGFTRAIEQVLVNIPNDLRRGAYALGATKVETMRRILLPQSIPGIITGIILSAGRIMAETAPLYLTIGMQGALNLDVLDQGWTLTTAIYNNQLYGTSDLLMRTIESYKIAALSIIVITLIISLAELVQPTTRWIQLHRRLQSLKRINYAKYLETKALTYEARRRRWPWLRKIDRARLNNG